MADREIKVRLTADGKQLQSELDKTADKAESFGSKLAGLAKQFGGLIAAGALGAFFKSAIEEASAAEVQMGRLGQAVTNAGGNFQKLRPQLEETVASVMRVSTATDDDLREALTRMIAVTGDVEGAQKNLSLVTDLAAFKQIDLADASTIVSKAMEGNTTALNKMGIEGKDAETVLANLQATVGGFAERESKTFSGALTRINNQWGEFQEAVGVAILSGGEAGGMADSLAGILGNLAGWIEQNEEGFRLVTGAIGTAVGALVDVGRTVYEVVEPALGPVFKVTLGALVGALNTASWAVSGLAAAFKVTAGGILEALGVVVEKGGGLLKLFGVQVVAETGSSIRTFGQSLRTAATDDMRRANETYAQGMKALLGGQKAAHGSIEQETRRHGDAVRTETERQKAERVRLAKEEADERERILKEVNAKLEQAAKGLNLATAELKGYWQQVDREARKAATTITLSKDEQRQLTDFSRSHAQAQAQVAAAAREAQQRFEDNVDSAASIATSLVSAASGMGKLSDEAATALTSVINMGASIAKFGIGSPEGILSIVGGLAQLIGGWGSSAAERARQEAHVKNTRALEELTQEFGDYNGSASGRVFSGVESAIGAAVATAGEEGRPATAVDVERELKKRGLTLADARRLAERFGIDVDKDRFGWSILGSILSSRKFGSPEGNFGDEIAALEESFDVLGIDDADDRIQRFRDKLKAHIPILADALSGDFSSEGGRAAIVAKLRDLYEQSVSGKLPTADYKNATPQQFRQIVRTLLGFLGGADGLLASGVAAGTGATGGPVGTPGTGGTASSVQLSGLALASALGATDLPAPRFPDGFLSGGSLGAGTTIHGGVTFNLPIQAPEGEPSEEFARRIAVKVNELLHLEFDRQRLATGGL